MALVIRPVLTKKQLRQFLKLPWKIYKGNSCWVPPLLRDLKNSLNPLQNPTLQKIRHRLFLAYVDGKPAGRIYAGMDIHLNQKKGTNRAFFSLFECIHSYEVAKLLLDTALNWAKENGADMISGPASITGTDGDENKGLLIDCFDRPPVLMNSYNPRYYKDFMEQYGFEKEYDVFAYYLDKDKLFRKDPAKIIEYAQKRYDFRVDPFNPAKLEEEILSIKSIIDRAMPEEWPDQVPPSLEEVRELAKKLLPLADTDLIPIARHGNDPIGFAIALPDYNQILIHLNGRLTPLAALKYPYYKRRIKSARVFVMFVVPEFRNKGVSFAIYHTAFKNGVSKGYTWGEGSTIGETNLRMRADIEGTGATRYKTYRIYKKDL